MAATSPAAVAQSQAPVQPAPKVSASESKNPTVAAKKKATVKKKSTISCVKGSKLIKVTATSPSCPAGFRRK